MRKMFFASVFATLAIAGPIGVSALHGEAPAARATARAEPSRVLPLQGGQNFRDLGGYRTIDGRTVRWRVLFRSGAMDRLTAADFAYLGRLGIRTVCDLRSTDERKAAPVRWPGGKTPRVFADDYAFGDVGFDFRQAANWTGDDARARMAATYSQTLDKFNGQYRRMFDELVAGRAPLAFNCSAGKDRTGVAAALILTALGVPRETVIEDYLLSNRYFDSRRGMVADDPAFAAWRQLPPDALKAMMGVDRSYIEAAFRVIDAHPGGTEGYLRDRLGLDPADLLTLRRRYTTR